MPPMNPLDMEGVSKTPARKLIIKKHPKESVASFLQRGKKRGVLRKCNSCGFRRSFDMLECPMCGKYDFHQVMGEVQNPDVETDFDQPDFDPRQQPAPQADGGNFQFTPNPDYDPNKLEEESTTTQVRIDRPLVELSNGELLRLGTSRGIDMSGAGSREEIMKRLEDSIGGVPQAENTAGTEGTEGDGEPGNKETSSSGPGGVSPPPSAASDPMGEESGNDQQEGTLAETPGPDAPSKEVPAGDAPSPSSPSEEAEPGGVKAQASPKAKSKSKKQSTE